MTSETTDRRTRFREWRKESRAWLRANPRCARCDARGTFAPAVIVQCRVDRGATRVLESLCQDCAARRGAESNGGDVPPLSEAENNGVNVTPFSELGSDEDEAA